MTPLRQRMLEDMQLRGLSEITQERYVIAVRQLAEHYGKSPDQLSEAELRDYFLYLKNDKQASRSTCTIALYAIKFLYEQTLQRKWPLFSLVRPPRERKLPVILSRAEVQRLLSGVRLPHYRVCLSTIYACDLRQGKGNKDRYVPLPQCTLAMLREYWVTHRHPVWLFPARGRAGIPLPQATQPLSGRSVRRAFQAALKESGLHKAATAHTLRHSYATHWLEAGVNLRLIQTYLGRRSLRTTALYTHLTRQTETQAAEVIEALMADLP